MELGAWDERGLDAALDVLGGLDTMVSVRLWPEAGRSQVAPLSSGCVHALGVLGAAGSEGWRRRREALFEEHVLIQCS